MGSQPSSAMSRERKERTIVRSPGGGRNNLATRCDNCNIKKIIRHVQEGEDLHHLKEHQEFLGGGGEEVQ